MATNKVIYRGVTLMDVTDSTVTPETLGDGIVAYAANGERIVGTNKGGSGDDEFSLDKYFEGGYAEVNLPNATKIRDYGFSNYKTLQTISMPKVTSIGANAFAGCTKLNMDSLPDGITSIGDSAFMSCENLALTSLPSGLTSIAKNAFIYCSNLALTSLPSGVTSIGQYSFSNCSNLALTSLPSGLKRIDATAFGSCPKLALTSLPSEITNIGSYAFSDCLGLVSITFEGKPSSIGSSAFYNCTNLTTINVPWAEGEVRYAPWGATNATINYNYTGG